LNKLSCTYWNYWRDLPIALSSTVHSKSSVKKLAIIRDGEPKAIQFCVTELATKAGISQDILFKLVTELDQDLPNQQCGEE
jgi:hypothetical protein